MERSLNPDLSWYGLVHRTLHPLTSTTILAHVKVDELNAKRFDARTVTVHQRVNLNTEHVFAMETNIELDPVVHRRRTCLRPPPTSAGRLTSLGRERPHAAQSWVSTTLCPTSPTSSSWPSKMNSSPWATPAQSLLACASTNEHNTLEAQPKRLSVSRRILIPATCCVPSIMWTSFAWALRKKRCRLDHGWKCARETSKMTTMWRRSCPVLIVTLDNTLSPPHNETFRQFGIRPAGSSMCMLLARTL